MKKVLFINGFGCNDSIWRFVKDNLNRRIEFVTINRELDLVSGFYSIEDFSKDILNKHYNLIKSCDYIVGHSMGGLIAVDIAEKMSHLKIVLVESFITTPPPFFRNIFYDKSLKSIISDTEDMMKKEGVFYSDELKASLRDIDIENRVKKIDNRVSFIYGSRGETSKKLVIENLSISEYFNDKIEIIKHSSHFPMLEKPDELIKILLKIIYLEK